MKRVFSDTLYWGGAIHPHDQYREQAICAQQSLGDVRLITTDGVLTELLDAAVRTILGDRACRFIRSSAHLF